MRDTNDDELLEQFCLAPETLSVGIYCVRTQRKYPRRSAEQNFGTGKYVQSSRYRDEAEPEEKEREASLATSV